jgi:hypothetical protein
MQLGYFDAIGVIQQTSKLFEVLPPAANKYLINRVYCKWLILVNAVERVDLGAV